MLTELVAGYLDTSGHGGEGLCIQQSSVSFLMLYDSRYQGSMLRGYGVGDILCANHTANGAGRYIG